MKIDRIEDLIFEGDRPAMQRGASPGGVLVNVHHASLVFKAKAALASARFIREFPIVPSIFLTGTVVKSDDPAYRVGDRVVKTGWDLGEHHAAGYGRYACLRSDWGIGNFYADEPLPLSP